MRLARPQRLSLRARLLWTFLVPLALVLVLVGAVSTAKLRGQLVGQVDTRLDAALSRSSHAVAGDGPPLQIPDEGESDDAPGGPDFLGARGQAAGTLGAQDPRRHRPVRRQHRGGRGPAAHHGAERDRRRRPRRRARPDRRPRRRPRQLPGGRRHRGGRRRHRDRAAAVQHGQRGHRPGHRRGHRRADRPARRGDRRRARAPADAAAARPGGRDRHQRHRAAARQRRGRAGRAGAARPTPIRGPRWAGSAPRSTGCSTTSSSRSPPGRPPRCRCGSSSPTRATSCGRRWPRSAGTPSSSAASSATGRRHPGRRRAHAAPRRVRGAAHVRARRRPAAARPPGRRP